VRRSWLNFGLVGSIGAIIGLTAAACGGSSPVAPEATVTQAPTATATMLAPSPMPVPTDTAQPTTAPAQPAATPESADDLFSAYGNLILLDGVVQIVAQMARRVEAGSMSPATARDGMGFLESQLLPGIDVMLQAPAPADEMQPAWDAAREVFPLVRETVGQAAAGDTTAAEAAATLESAGDRLAKPMAAVEAYLAEEVGLDRESQSLGREWMLAELRAALGLPPVLEATATPE
jgi:hypothetical protein